MGITLDKMEIRQGRGQSQAIGDLCHHGCKIEANNPANVGSQQASDNTCASANIDGSFMRLGCDPLYQVSSELAEDRGDVSLVGRSDSIEDPTFTLKALVLVYPQFFRVTITQAARLTGRA
jgi:hypothetical protein